MRKFNAFRHFLNEEPRPAVQKEETKPMRQYSAYRTVLNKHEAVKNRLKDEPVAVIEQN